MGSTSCPPIKFKTRDLIGRLVWDTLATVHETKALQLKCEHTHCCLVVKTTIYTALVQCFMDI